VNPYLYPPNHPSHPGYRHLTRPSQVAPQTQGPVAQPARALESQVLEQIGRLHLAISTSSQNLANLSQGLQKMRADLETSDRINGGLSSRRPAVTPNTAETAWTIHDPDLVGCFDSNQVSQNRAHSIELNPADEDDDGDLVKLARAEGYPVA
jgi:hypothetical protein